MAGVMSESAIIVVSGIIGTILGALIAQAPALRRVPSQARLDDANAEKAQHESAAIVNKELRDEIARQGTKITALEVRAIEYERRTTLAETSFADAETRSTRSRQNVVVLGEKLDEARATIDKLVILIDHLITIIESPAKAGEVDMPGVKAMMCNMRRGWAS